MPLHILDGETDWEALSHKERLFLVSVAFLLERTNSFRVSFGEVVTVFGRSDVLTTRDALAEKGLILLSKDGEDIPTVSLSGDAVSMFLVGVRYSDYRRFDRSARMTEAIHATRKNVGLQMPQNT